jgi:membrane fusion protein, peptide pheromone/bacteriocin exporter
MIIDASKIKDTAIWWLPSMRRSGFIIYWLVMVLFLTGFIALFFIHMDISVRASGIIRPLNERTEMRSPLSGIIDTMYYKEGEQVEKGNILMVFRDPSLTEKQQMNEADILQCSDFIHDLELLTSSRALYVAIVSSLITPLYKQEAFKFFSGSDEQRIILEKAKHETTLNEKLAEDKVISPKEFYDIRIQQQKAIAAFESFRREQFAGWQADRVKYNTEIKQCISRRIELNQLFETNRIRAPISGSLQELSGRYAGNSIQAGESICSISPDGNLMGECYVSSRDIGLLKTGQPAKFQIDALNYNYFGAGTGNIFSIDNDFILLDKTPVFKVRCRMNEKILRTSNGFPGELKKGMSFQARFITCNRTLWQLLYEGLNDWLK